MKICGIAGYAENWSFSNAEVDGTFAAHCLRISKAIKRSIAGGTEGFVVSMDDNIGLLSANIILLMKKRYPHVQLRCLMLWEEQAARWPESVRATWFYVFEHCDQEIMLEHHQSKNNLQKRDKYLVEHCDGLLLFSERGAEALAWPLLARARLEGLNVQEQRLGH